MKDKAVFVQNLFDSIAVYYDLANTILAFGQDRYWRRFTTNKIKEYRPVKILDVCTGTGMLSLAIAREIKDCNIIAIDFSKEMLKRAERNLNRYGEANRISLFYGDAMNLEFNTDSFDCATIAFGLRNVESIFQVISELKRVVKPGGVVVTLELSKPQNGFFRDIYYFYFYKLLPAIGRMISGNDYAYSYLSHSLTHFPDRYQLEKIFRRTGLINVRSYPLTGGIVAVHMGEKGF